MLGCCWWPCSTRDAAGVLVQLSTPDTASKSLLFAAFLHVFICCELSPHPNNPHWVVVHLFHVSPCSHALLSMFWCLVFCGMSLPGISLWPYMSFLSNISSFTGIAHNCSITVLLFRYFSSDVSHAPSGILSFLWALWHFKLKENNFVFSEHPLCARHRARLVLLIISFHSNCYANSEHIYWTLL